MGSLVVKLDAPTMGKLKGRHHYLDVDMLSYMGTTTNVSNEGTRVVSEVPVVHDVQAVKMAVRNILTWRVGESVIRPEFGHKLHLSMYAQMNDFNQEAVCEEIKRAVEENEPRVEVETVSVKRGEDSEGNALHVRLVYSVVGDDTEGATITEETTVFGK